MMMDPNTNTQQQQQGSEQPVNLNLKYAKTKKGLLKILSVVLGLLAVILVSYAWDNATVAQPIQSTICDVIDNTTEKVVQFKLCYPGMYPRDDICEYKNKYLKLNFKYQKKSWDDRKLKKEEIDKETKNYNKRYRVCPSRWLVIPQIYVVGLIWADAFIVLIAMLYSERIVQKFSKIDFLVHIVAAVFTILSGLCFIGFFISVLWRDDCRRFTSKNETMGVGHVGTRDEKDSQKPELPSEPGDECYFLVAKYYKHWHIFYAGVFAISTGAVYILIALASARGFRRSGPKMGQQENMNMSPSQAQMQGSSSQQMEAADDANPSQAPPSDAENA